MTTIISLDGKLYADRHKIINHPVSGMIGAEQAMKLSTTKFCHYATTGFVPTDKAKEHIERSLAVMFTLLGLINQKGLFFNSPAGELFYTIPGAAKLLYTAGNLITDNIKMYLSREDIAGIIAVNHRYIVYIKNDIVAWSLADDCYTLGSSSTMASILLHHGETIESVYSGICGSTAPTGANYDMLDTKVFDNNLYPPFCDAAFLGNLLGHCDSYLSSAEKLGTKEEISSLKHDIVTLASALTVLGKINIHTNRLTFTKKMSKELLLAAISPENKIYRRYSEGEKA